MVLDLNVSMENRNPCQKPTVYCLPDDLCKCDSTCPVLMNAMVFVACGDQKYTVGQLNHRNGAACTVDLAHKENRGRTPVSVHLIKQAHSSLGTGVQSGSATASVLCLRMPCSVGILPPTASSCSASLAHISAPAPLRAVHGSY